MKNTRGQGQPRDGQEERNQEHKKMKTTMTMAKNNTSRNAQKILRQSQGRGNQKHERTTMVMATRSTTKNTRGWPQP